VPLFGDDSGDRLGERGEQPRRAHLKPHMIVEGFDFSVRRLT
jgi:hypothetical protein